jgi:alpha-1,2-mannosyltransferase
VLALACVVTAALLVRAATRRGDHVLALTATAALGLLLSPISWTHHWVWVVLPCCLLVTQSRRGLLALAAVVACFSGWTFGVVPRGENRELTWSLLESVIGNAYVLLALVAGAVTLVHLLLKSTVDVRTVTPRSSAGRPHGDGLSPAVGAVRRSPR